MKLMDSARELLPTDPLRAARLADRIPLEELDPAAACEAIALTAQAYRLGGRPDLALKRLRAAEDGQLTPSIMIEIGCALAEHGRYGEAVNAAQAARRASADAHERARCRVSEALWTMRTGDPRTARYLFGRTLPLLAPADRRHRVACLLGRAQCAAELRLPWQAWSDLDAAAGEAIGSELAHYHWVAAHAHKASGEQEDALDEFRRAAELMRTAKPIDHLLVRLDLSRVLIEAGELAEAAEVLAECQRDCGRTSRASPMTALAVARLHGLRREIENSAVRSVAEIADRQVRVEISRRARR